MRLTSKLLSFLHRVYDKDPERFLAFRLGYDGGMVWKVQDAVLTTTVTGGSGVDLTVNLSDYTLSQLIVYLAGRTGYTVLYGDNSELSVLSSRILMDGTNDIATSNGDHLYGYTSALWSYLEACSVELALAETEIKHMVLQMSTKTAQDMWLDELGGYYHVPREPGEIDQNYGPRIIVEVLRPRANNVAMEAAIKEYTGQQTTVTDVVLYGDTFPLYDGDIDHDGTWDYDADAMPQYGLFDVEYGYDLLNGGDMADFADTVRGIINRLRDAGTHLRALSLQAGALFDTYPPPEEGIFGVGVAISPFSEADDASNAIEAAGIVIAYDHRYNGVRTYNGIIYHRSGEAEVVAL